MTDTELLSHYNLTNLEPVKWPTEKDEEDEVDDELDLVDGQSRPKYASLERGATVHRSIPGSQRGKDGLQNLVHKDESDPLGRGMSVMQLLHRQGLHVNDDIKTRNQFLLSSTTFSPTIYISQAHGNDSIEELLQGLDFLSNSIEQKSASLKVLVESNFERFVRAKSTIDNVYSEMRKHGDEQGVESLPSPRMRMNRTVSGQGYSSLRRGGKSMTQPSPTTRTFVDERRKNALTKDSEYGVQGIRVPLTEASGKAEEVWGPALGGRDREESLKSVLTSIERNRAILDVGSALEDCINMRDYPGVAANYSRAHKYAMEAKVTTDRAKQNNLRLNDAQLQQVLITARVWSDVCQRIDTFKREIWERLSSMSLSAPLAKSSEDEELGLVSLLLDLGTEDNPITTWLRNRIEYFKARISITFDRARVELEIARRKLASGRRPGFKTLANHMRMAGRPRRRDQPEASDVPQVISFWEKICSNLNALLSAQNGLLEEIIEFADTLQSFVDGKRQRSLPVGIDGQSRKHHELDSKAVYDLRAGTLNLFASIRKQVHGLLVDVPVEDVSTLMSAIPQTPATPTMTPMSPMRATLFSFRPEDIPPPSPRTGEPWEKYAFWPPHSNSLSAGIYLHRILNMTADAAGRMVSVNMVAENGNLSHRLRNLVNEVRERAVTALCAAWLSDSENCQELEDWTRSNERKDLTNLASWLSGFEMALHDDLQMILYLPDLHKSTKRVIGPPPQSIIETVQRAFKASLLKSLSTIIEHAARTDQEHGDADDDGLTAPSVRGLNSAGNDDGLDAGNTNVRKILTMSNLSYLRSDTLPKLYAHFEGTFSVTAADDLKSLRDALHAMHSRVFQSYIRPTVDRLWSLITSGIVTLHYATPYHTTSVDPNGSGVATAMPTDARPYIYTVLLTLVLIHAELTSVAPTSNLVISILSTLLEQISAAFLHAFSQRPRYNLPALMQATLDVEFTAQTLNQYTTEKVAEAQGLIYGALDERTDNEARLRLQGELPGMRAVLKRLREGTRGVFGCFRKEKKKSVGDSIERVVSGG